MADQTRDTAEAYVATLAGYLRAMPDEERLEVCEDIRGHFEEARAAGATDAETARQLGPPKVFARGYLIETAVNVGPAVPSPALASVTELAALVIATSIPTLIVATVLGAITIAFTVSGLAVTAGGIALVAGFDPNWVKWPYATWLAFIVGPGLAVAGGSAFVALRAYVRFIAKAIIRRLPKRGSKRNSSGAEIKRSVDIA